MNCKDISGLLTAYLDSEVTPEEEEQVRAHISTCPHCRQELEALAATQNSLRRALKTVAAGATPSAQAWAQIRQRLAVEEQPRVTVWRLVKSKLKGGKDIMVGGLIVRRPVWKVAVVGMLVMELILGLSLTLLSPTTDTAYAQAADIARNSPQVQAALGGGEVTVIKVVQMIDDKGTVICRGETGRIVTADVDLKSKEVIELVTLPELTEEAKERAISIAKADPRVQEILAQGATVYKVSPILHFGTRVTEAGDVEEFSGALALVAIAFDPSDVHGRSWSVQVDLNEEKVVDIITKEPVKIEESEGKWEIEYLQGNIIEKGNIEK